MIMKTRVLIQHPVRNANLAKMHNTAWMPWSRRRIPAYSIPGQRVVQHLEQGARAITEGVALPTRTDEAIERHYDGEAL